MPQGKSRWRRITFIPLAVALNCESSFDDCGASLTKARAEEIASERGYSALSVEAILMTATEESASGVKRHALVLSKVRGGSWFLWDMVFGQLGTTWSAASETHTANPEEYKSRPTDAEVMGFYKRHIDPAGGTAAVVLDCKRSIN